jgi:hypothetical protein
MRIVDDGDRLQAADLGNPDRAHAIMAPDGEVIMPRPRAGMRFVGWETKAGRDEAWKPMPAHGQACRYVRALYAPDPSYMEGRERD